MHCVRSEFKANSDQHMKSLFMRRVWSYVGKY